MVGQRGPSKGSKLELIMTMVNPRRPRTMADARMEQIETILEHAAMPVLDKCALVHEWVQHAELQAASLIVQRLFVEDLLAATRSTGDQQEIAGPVGDDHSPAQGQEQAERGTEAVRDVQAQKWS